MSTPPEPKGEPEPSALEVLINRTHGWSQYTDEIAEKAALELSNLRSERDEARRERDALRTEHTKSQAALLAMMNTNQARAQSAAQATAKIAQELQIYLKEHAPNVVEL